MVLDLMIKNKNPEAIMVAENWMESSQVAQYFREFDMNFNFDLGTMIVNTARNMRGSGLIDTLPLNYEAFSEYNENFIDAPFIKNHDQNRPMSEFVVMPNKIYINRAKKQMKHATLMLLTMGGAPFIYYGEEIGQMGKKPDENIREPFDWYKDAKGEKMTKWMRKNGIRPKYTKPNDGISVEEQKGVQDSLLEHYRKLISLRKENPAMRSYEIEKLDIKNKKLYAYTKLSNNQKIAVILNFDNRKAQKFDVKNVFGSETIYDLYNSKDISGEVEVEKHGFMLVEYK